MSEVRSNRAWRLECEALRAERDEAEARLVEAKGLLEEIGDEWPAVKRTTVERAYAFIERAADNSRAAE